VPNPFNPATTIHYDVARGGGEVTLQIFDAKGRLVRTLVDGSQSEGQKTATWNGLNGSGQQVATGVYFYRLRAQGFSQTRTMVLLK
jgi:flagellar hook assembly protein FlgD